MVGALALGVPYGALQNLTLLIAFARVPSAGIPTASAVWNIGFDAGTATGAVVVGAVAAASSFGRRSWWCWSCWWSSSRSPRVSRRADRRDNDRVTPQGVIWDLGNVLIDWQPHAAVAAGLGDQEATRFFAAEDFDFSSFNHALDAGGTWEQSAAELGRTHPHWAEHAAAYYTNFEHSLVGEVPGTVEIVRELNAAGVPMFGLTNWPHELGRMPPAGSSSSGCSTAWWCPAPRGSPSPTRRSSRSRSAGPGSRPRTAASSMTSVVNVDAAVAFGMAASSSAAPTPCGAGCASGAASLGPVSRAAGPRHRPRGRGLARAARARGGRWLAGNGRRPGRRLLRGGGRTVRQPVNTLSNLGFVVAGLAIAVRLVGPGGWHGHDARRPGLARPTPAWWCCSGRPAWRCTRPSRAGRSPRHAEHVPRGGVRRAYAAMRRGRGPCSWPLSFVVCLAACVLVGTYAGRSRWSVPGNLAFGAFLLSPRWCSSASTPQRTPRPRPALAGRRGGSLARVRGLEHRQGPGASAGRARSTRATASGTCCAQCRRTACSGST